MDNFTNNLYKCLYDINKINISMDNIYINCVNNNKPTSKCTNLIHKKTLQIIEILENYNSCKIIENLNVLSKNNKIDFNCLKKKNIKNIHPSIYLNKIDNIINTINKLYIKIVSSKETDKKKYINIIVNDISKLNKYIYMLCDKIK